MRLSTIAAGAALLLSAAAPTAACEFDVYAAETASPAVASAPATELSAEEKKADKKKPMKRMAKKKAKIPQEKVEYMRAAPLPPGSK